MRDKKYSRDFTTTEETLKHALEQAENYYNIKFDICVFLAKNDVLEKLAG